MYRLLLLIASLGFALAAHAAGTVALDRAPNKLNDLPALQNGAKLFVNYCLGCHSAASMRFSRLTDIGLTEQQIKDNLLLVTDKLGETMKANINPKEAKEWFGANPPDLSVIARATAGRGGSGADYLYTYLRSYYRDTAKATGWDNLVFPSVAMPHAMWQLQGERRPIFDTRIEQGKPVQTFSRWEVVTPGTMTSPQYDEAVGDLVGFLQWMGEPAQNTRLRVGAWVLLFLGVLMFFTWRLNAAFWKDVK